MIKLMGLICIFSAAVLCGNEFSVRVRLRYEAIVQIIEFFRQLAIQLEYYRAPTGQIIVSLAAREQFSSNQFIRELAKAMRETDNFTDALSMVNRESSCLENLHIKENIDTLCGIIGCTDAESQLLAIKGLLVELENHASLAAEDNKRKGSLYRKLGVIAGAFIVIILL